MMLLNQILAVPILFLISLMFCVFGCKCHCLTVPRQSRTAGAIMEQNRFERVLS